MGVAAENTMTTHAMVFRSAMKAARRARMTVDIEDIKTNPQSNPRLDTTFMNFFPSVKDRGSSIETEDFLLFEGPSAGEDAPPFFFVPNTPNTMPVKDATSAPRGPVKSRHLFENNRKSLEKKLSPMLRTNFRGI